jgi:hypothetical protein
MFTAIRRASFLLSNLPWFQFRPPICVFLSPSGEPIIFICDPLHGGFRLAFLHIVCDSAAFFGAHTPIAGIRP